VNAVLVLVLLILSTEEVEGGSNSHFQSHNVILFVADIKPQILNPKYQHIILLG
jgi:hypothetical protein